MSEYKRGAVNKDNESSPAKIRKTTVVDMTEYKRKAINEDNESSPAKITKMTNINTMKSWTNVDVEQPKEHIDILKKRYFDEIKHICINITCKACKITLAIPPNINIHKN